MSLFRKNIRYNLGQDLDLIESLITHGRKSPGAFTALILDCQQRGGDAGLAEIAGKILQVSSGTQFIVQKELSDELQHVDFDNARFEQLEWPSISIEFYYEDPALPTILVSHSPKEGLLIELALAMWGEGWRKIVPNWQSWGEPALGAICDNADDLTACTVTHDVARWQDALKTGHHLAAGHVGDRGLVQNEAETFELHQMLNLSLKVLAYSAIPQFKPVPVTRKQMGRGPKAGVAGRPERPAFRTVYLPRLVTASTPRESPADGQEPGASHEFRGRRGHIRHFTSDYFKNMKGKWIYVPPVIVPGMAHNVRFKVRKV